MLQFRDFSIRVFGKPGNFLQRSLPKLSFSYSSRKGYLVVKNLITR